MAGAVLAAWTRRRACRRPSAGRPTPDDYPAAARAPGRQELGRGRRRDADRMDLPRGALRDRCAQVPGRHSRCRTPGVRCSHEFDQRAAGGADPGQGRGRGAARGPGGRGGAVGSAGVGRGGRGRRVDPLGGGAAPGRDDGARGEAAAGRGGGCAGGVRGVRGPVDRGPAGRSRSDPWRGQVPVGDRSGVDEAAGDGGPVGAGGGGGRSGDGGGAGVAGSAGHRRQGDRSGCGRGVGPVGRGGGTVARSAAVGADGGRVGEPS